MGMMFSMTMVTEQKMDITTEMSAVNNIFPRVVDFLEEDDHIRGVEYVAKRKNMNKYRAVMDFLVGEFFGGEFRRACFAYYEGTGKPFRELLDDDLRAKMEAVLLFAVARAYDHFNNKRKTSWGWFVKDTTVALIEAA